MCDDDIGLQLPGENVLEKFWQKALHMRLAHLESRTFVECVAEEEPMNEAGIYTGHTHDSATSNGGNSLAQCFTAAALQLQVCKHRFGGTALRFESDGVDHGVHAAVICVLDDEFRGITNFVEVDWNRTTRVCVQSGVTPSP